jgi:hypothetical protein
LVGWLISEVTFKLSLNMSEQKKMSELVEASLIWALSAMAGLLGFFLIWLICLLSGFQRG